MCVSVGKLVGKRTITSNMDTQARDMAIMADSLEDT